MDSLGQFIRDRLQAEGYDGLCNPDLECGCSLDDLFPCGEPEINDCMPAYFRHRIDSCSCTAEPGPDPCLCNRRLEWWEGKFAHNPIEWFNADMNKRPGRGFYFWDETWADVIGPYPTPNAAKAELFDYCNNYLGG